MPVLPQAFWYKVDGKLKQVFFEEAKVPQDKREALLKQLQRTRNYAGGATSAPVPPDEQQPEHSTQKEKLYGWYPPEPGAQYVTVAQANLDRRVMRPNDHRAVPAIPDDKTREPVSTQIGPDGVPACIPPFPTDPMAYKFSVENTTQVPSPKATPDFGKWETEEAGRIPQWNDIVTFHGTSTSLPDRPRTIAVVDPQSANTPTDILPQLGQRQSSVIQPPPEATTQQPVRRGSARGGMRVEATPVTSTNNNAMMALNTLAAAANGITDDKSSSRNGHHHAPHGTSSSASTEGKPTPSLSLREIETMQKKLSQEYRWRFNVQGDPFAVKGKVRPARPAHWMPAKVEAPKPNERPICYADSTTFFYNTIPIIPLSFSVGQGLASEKVIREREAKQKYAPKSTPNDRYFVPAFIY